VMGVLDIIAKGMLSVGLLAALGAVILIAVVHIRVAFAQPDFWWSQFYFARRRLDYQNRTLREALKAENATRTGRVADLLLRWATGLLLLGGVGKGIVAIIERQIA
jgi:hypothetical protein